LYFIIDFFTIIYYNIKEIIKLIQGGKMNTKLFKELIKELENHEKRITIVEKVVDSNSKDIAKLEMENRNLEIKLGLAKGEKASDLARKYGVGKSRISQIKNS
jgi:hypothetical protein